MKPILTAIALTALCEFAPLPASAQQPSAIERMQEPGAQAAWLARRAGLRNVTMRLTPQPGAEPIVMVGMIAERRMVGLFLEEVLRPAPGASGPDFRRIAYLTYNRVEGRWQYVSLDTRFPAGIMPAWSFEPGTERSLTLQFEGLGFVGFGEAVEGRLVRSNFVIEIEGEEREFGRQFWTQADGTGRQWLAVEYEYTRRRE